MRFGANIPALAIVFAVLANTAGAATARISADQAGFDQSIEPFLARYCTDCHGRDVQEANLSLAGLDYTGVAGREIELWNKVGEMLTFHKMPPSDAAQPKLDERLLVVDWLEQQLRTAGGRPDWKHKLHLPDYGNLIEHHALFDGPASSVGFTPSRLWKRSPFIFDALRAQGMGFGREKHKRFSSQLENVKQPFTMEDRAGIKDFAAMMIADSSTLDTLLRNAEVVVDKHLEAVMHELDVQSGTAPLDEQGRPIRPANAKTPAEFREIVLGQQRPTDEVLDAAIRCMYGFVIDEPPSPEELAKFRGLFHRLAAVGGNAEGLRTMLIAIAVSPPVVYRQEIGVGPHDDHGRQMLSPANLAFALSYALTDEKPDDALREAARAGRLHTRADVLREVTRMWDDDQLSKPRVLRFFQEFFGYDRAPQVFKDDNRFGRSYSGNAKVADWLVKDADTLVMHIVKRDRHVLAELLTTELFFVGHSGNNEEAHEIARSQAAVYEYLKDKDWKNWPYNLPEPHGAQLRSLSSNYSHVNGPMVHSHMAYLVECKKHGVQPLPHNLRREFLAAYDLDEKTFDYPVEQPFPLAPGKRAGILMHPAWLIAHSQNLDNDPVRRGKWIRERLLADAVPELPIKVDATIPDEPDQTLRHRFRVTQAAECWRCHVQMNPLGMPFESFDDFGRFREVEVLHAKGKSAPVDSRGELVGTRDTTLDGPVENPVELVHRLAKSERARQSFVRHAFRYWMGRNEMLSDASTVQAADQAYVESGGSFRALVLSLLTSDSFLYRKSIGLEDHE